MSESGLSERELALLRGVLRRHPEVTKAKLFGSRAKGTHTQNSDIDIALWGDIHRVIPIRVAGELEELPLPYTFDVQAFEATKTESLREEIETLGVEIYRNSRPQSGSEFRL